MVVASVTIFKLPFPFKTSRRGVCISESFHQLSSYLDHVGGGSGLVYTHAHNVPHPEHAFTGEQVK